MAAPALNLRDLRALLDARFPDATPVPRRTADAVATGIEALDAILPNGGFPKGRLSVWAPRGGATAVLRAAASAAAEAGERVAWIDGSGTIAGAWWQAGPVLLKPTDRVRALRAAEHLLRSGGFALVVLTGAEPVGTEHVRLSRAAHEGGAAFVTIAANAAMAALKVASQIEPDAYRWARDPHGDPASVTSVTMSVRVMSLGWSRRARLAIPVVEHGVPSALSAALPDRRGVPETKWRDMDIAPSHQPTRVPSVVTTRPHPRLAAVANVMQKAVQRAAR